MRVAIVSLFPELFAPFLGLGLVGRAVRASLLEVQLIELRRFGLGRHQSIDDTPYGGGAGMVMRPDCVVAAIEAAEQSLGADPRPTRVLLTPQGAAFEQSTARELSTRAALILVCGRYEGFDERVREHVDLEVSIGDFVLTGGEVAAMCVIEAAIRLVPGVLGNSDSPREESFSALCQGRLEYPQYTRPADFRGSLVPEVLVSGDHQKVQAWREAESLKRTRQRRPDLPKGGRGQP